MPTMKDVAKRAGVSLGTVSNVLNNRKTVLPENKERVLKAVEELGFRTNMVARALKTKASNDIALIIPDFNNPFFPELARGVEDEANKAGLQVLLCNSDRMAAKEQKYIESLITKNISGLIMVKMQLPLEYIGQVCKKMPVVLVDAGLPACCGYDVINIDDKGGTLKGLELLYSEGHTRIGFISGMMDSASSYSRYDTYLEFLEDKGLPTIKEYVIKGDYSWNSGYKASKVFMSLAVPPTAIFAANDLMAIGCIKALKELGLRVPQDVSVLGYDNIDMAKLCSPPLTTINQPKYDIGTLSVKMLLSRMELRQNAEDDSRVGEQTLLPTYVVNRESVAEVKR